jgi:hypothetical protein
LNENLFSGARPSEMLRHGAFLPCYSANELPAKSGTFRPTAPIKRLYLPGRRETWRALTLALDWPQYSKGKYGYDQRAAEQAGRGIRKGSYVEPWLYRVCIRAGGTPGRCSDDATPHPDEQHVGKQDR